MEDEKQREAQATHQTPTRQTTQGATRPSPGLITHTTTGGEIYSGQSGEISTGVDTFHVVKNLFRHKKTRDRGLDKNTKQLFTLFGLANLVLARRWLLAPDSRIAS